MSSLARKLFIVPYPNTMNPAKTTWHLLFLLIMAGESVFILPFVLARVFRPTVLQAFGLDNVQLGFCFSVYGIVALGSYLFGGPLADKYPPGKLMAIALWLTALGGLVYASFPSYTMLKILYGYWGFTTIFLFWAPMIKAARIWGGTANQGKAFGFLDGGRGLVGALFGTLGVVIFSFFLTTSMETATVAESSYAFRRVILVSSGIVALVGWLIWIFMKTDQQEEKSVVLEKISPEQIGQVLRLPSVWLLMLIILCAYVGYKVTDVLSLYANEVMGYSQVESAQVGTFLLFARPVVGVIIGILADRTNTTLWLLISFIITFLGALLFATGFMTNASTALFFMSILVVATGVYAARSLYFAVMESGQIPLVLTGTAVGIVSLAGYTPDIFAGPLIGYFLEAAPGIVGHQHVFWMLALFSAVGGVAAFIYHKKFATLTGR